MTLTAQLIIDAWQPLYGRVRPSDPAQREHEFHGWTGLAAAIGRLEEDGDPCSQADDDRT